MKLLRFMSIAELEKFRAGELLENQTDHHAQHSQKTNSVGFCFLDYDEYNERDAYHFLSGIVSPEICAVFEVDDVVAKKYLKKCDGRYAAPMNTAADFFSSMMVTEYSTMRYHDQGMQLLKYCDDFNDKWDKNYERVFEFKSPEAPITRKITVIDKNPVPRQPKPNTPEQHLLDAVEEFVRKMSPGVPDEFFDGFTLSAAPTMQYNSSFDGDTIIIEGLEFTKHRRSFL